MKEEALNKLQNEFTLRKGESGNVHIQMVGDYQGKFYVDFGSDGDLARRIRESPAGAIVEIRFIKTCPHCRQAMEATTIGHDKD